jgi:hypothetical protein
VSSRHLSACLLIIPPSTLSAGPVWDELAQFPDIYLVNGSPLSTSDLRRAGTATAGRAMILPQLSRQPSSGSSLQERLLRDADVVFAAQKLRKLNPGIEVVMELASAGNLPFLSPTRAMRGLGQGELFLLPAYTSGQVGVQGC